MDHGCSIDTSFTVTRKVLHHVFDALFYENVKLDSVILKPNMILDGYSFEGSKASRQDISELTLKCLKESVPPAIPAIAFLSGGQKDEDAINNLAAMNKEFYLPWALSFSFGRTMQTGALQHWSLSRPEQTQRWTTARAQSCANAVEGVNYMPVIPDIDFDK